MDDMRRLVWIIPAALVGLVLIVLAARWLREVPAVADFLVTYPGESALPAGAPVGLPAWLGWQHFLNGFFLLLIVRTGWQLRHQGRPDTFWVRRNTGLIRTSIPPTRLTLTAWFHLSLDALWVVTGLSYIVLLFATGQWVRVVPTSWDIVPNALSALLQYVSFDWPVTNGWINYNALQLITYFVTVFIASPLAIATGLRLSPLWSVRFKRITPFVPLAPVKTVHWLTMLWFVGFTAVHVTLVLTTGAVRNLNHIYAARDDESWLGVAVFAASLVVMIAAWVAARPRVLRWIAALGGEVIHRPN